MIAATALVAGMPLIHNNAADLDDPERDRAGSARFPDLGPLELIRCTSLA